MKKSVKKLIKKFEKKNQGLKVKYVSGDAAPFEVYNSGGLISVLKIHQLMER